MRNGRVVGLIVAMALVAVTAAAEVDKPVACTLCVCNINTPAEITIGCSSGAPPFTGPACSTACAPGTGNLVASSSDCGTDIGCPASEVGRCADGLNNDAYLNSATDALDLECARHVAPALSPYSLLTVGLLLFVGGIYRSRS